METIERKIKDLETQLEDLKKLTGEIASPVWPRFGDTYFTISNIPEQSSKRGVNVVRRVYRNDSLDHMAELLGLVFRTEEAGQKELARLEAFARIRGASPDQSWVDWNNWHQRKWYIAYEYDLLCFRLLWSPSTSKECGFNKMPYFKTEEEGLLFIKDHRSDLLAVFGA